MKILIDCDVLLDVYLGRQPHFVHSSAVLDWAEKHPGACCLAWHTAANLDFLIKGGARAFLEELLGFIDVPATGALELKAALGYPVSDLEDAMQVAAAVAAGAQVIVTRNVRDYAKSPLRSLTPAKVLAQLR